MRRRHLVRPLLALTALLGACTPLAGERASGGCPAGEICSPDTPSGLYFGGAILSDDSHLTSSGPRRLARGGIQTIRAFLDSQAREPFSPFQALAGGDHIAVLDRKDNAVRVRGVSPVGDFLRLVDPDNQELYDRVMLEVADVATVKIVPRESALFGDAELFEAEAPDVVFKSSNADNLFTIALVDATGVRLVDESLDVQTGAGFTHTSDFWDGLHQTGPVAPGTYDFNVKLGSGEIRQVGVTLVDKADALAWVPGTGADETLAPEQGLAAGQSQGYCFRATRGGVPVIGDELTYSVAGDLTLVDGNGCQEVQGLRAGSGTLTVRVDDVSLDVVIPVRASKRSASGDEDPLQGTPLPAITDAAAAGERAAAASAGSAR